jgi:hypothetical protein
MISSSDVRQLVERFHRQRAVENVLRKVSHVVRFRIRQSRGSELLVRSSDDPPWRSFTISNELEKASVNCRRCLS